MPIEIKDGFDANKYIQAAAERRVSDQAHTTLSKSEIQKGAKATRALRVMTPTMPPVAPGQVMNAISWSNYLRDAKMSMGIVASAGEGVGEEINLTTQRNFALLDDLQREAQALNAFVTEEEVKINGRFSKVHFNSWVRPNDSALAYDQSDWLIDYKTGLPFQADNMADIIQGTGLTLPLREHARVSIRKVTVVGEETDVGDTAEPVVSNNPKNLLRPNRVFRHVVIRTDHDNTSKKYNHTPSYLTLLLELSGVQLINTLNIRPLGQSTVYVESISYLNEAGEEIVLTDTELPSEVELTVLFEPVRTKYLKVKFRQYAPVSRQHYDASDIRVRELNKLLRGSGFSQLLDENPEEIMGRVYDFSLENISCALRMYENLGVYRSQPVAVNSPMGVSYSDNVETIDISNVNKSYGTSTFLEDGEVLLERYLGIDLAWTEGGRALRDLVPIPDARSTQREFLPMFSGVGRAKLYPDLSHTVVKNYVSSATWTSEQLTCVFDDGHGYTHTPLIKNTEKIILVAGPGEQANGFNFQSTEWYVIDANTLILVPTVANTSNTFTGFKINPYVFLDADQADPVLVYKEDELLVFGTDYSISIDNGSTYVTEWPRDGNKYALEAQAKAGKFKIKILAPDSTKMYWTEYRLLRNQQLSKKPGVSLKRGRVVFDKRFSATSGTISTVIVSRADSVNPYLTPVLLSYFLRVREHVS